MMTIRHRFTDFVESLQEPRRKFGAVCFLLVFLFVDFMLGGIYFLAGFFSLKNIGPAAEMAAEIADLYQISVYVDTSEYLYWSIPFFVLAVITAVFTVRYIVKQKRVLARASRPARPKERINAMDDAVVAVRVHAVNPTKAKKEDLRHDPPAWLLDPLAVVSAEQAKSDFSKSRAEDLYTRSQQPQPAEPAADPQSETPFANTATQQQREEPAVNTATQQQGYYYEQPSYSSAYSYTQQQVPYSYSDFVRPHSVSAPHNRLRRDDKKKPDIPYAGSLQYVERKDKKKERSPYENYNQ
ncbi:MAG: hypothetical protein IJO14_12750 [Clostridia bacterium]|nr:hypothetical protein [Clostridia bacterium]